MANMLISYVSVFSRLQRGKGVTLYQHLRIYYLVCCARILMFFVS